MDINSDIIIVIQARMNSSRLPGKILMPFANNFCTLDYLIYNLKKIKIPIYIATTNLEKDNIIEEKYNKEVKIYRGSEVNVLKRFIDIGYDSKAKYIIRVCSDNPFIVPEYIQLLINRIRKVHFDYLSFHFNNTHVMQSSAGLFTELVSYAALQKTYDQASDQEKEHVTFAIYTRFKKEFSIKLFDILKINSLLKKLPELRLTLDTEHDFKILNEIIKSQKLSVCITEKTINTIINSNQLNKVVNKMKEENKRKINSKEYKP